MVISCGIPPAESQPVAPLNARQLLHQIRNVERKVRKLRRLPARRYNKAVVTGAELQKIIQQAAARQRPDAELALEQAVWQRLGLLPPGADYKKALARLSRADSAVAYYDHHKRRLYLRDDARLPDHGPALAKEVCHALQDQRFRVKRLVSPITNDRDRQLAGRALVEGDCAGVMLEYMLAPQKDLGSFSGDLGRVLRAAASGQGSKLGAVPLLVRETSLFPLVHGLQFVQRVRARHPWGVVDKLYRRPPLSTEQVLHPRKYWRGEKPSRVRAAALPALADHKQVHAGVLGELLLSLLLRQGVSADSARRAAAGWGGDLLVAYQPATAGAPPGLVHMTAWDSEADAVEFANAMRHVLAARKMKEAAGASEGLWVHLEGASARWSVQLFKRHVLVLGGFSSEKQTALQQEVWQRWRVGGRRVRPKM